MGVINVDISEEKTKVTRRTRDRPSTTIAALIAIDPGETTGWSLMTVDPICLSDPHAKVLANILSHQHGEVDEKRGPEKFPNDGECLMVDSLVALIHSWPHAAVVIEDFTLRIKNKSRSLLSPVRVTAKLEQELWRNGRIYFKQTPNDAKTACNDERLRRWGMYEREGGLEHARDADRHAMLFLRRCTQSRRLRENAWPHLFKRGAPYA
jgi:hypothetical protein